MDDIKNKYLIIENTNDDSSTALCLDIRNSTKLVNQYSINQLKFHSEFLIDLKELIYQDGVKGELSVNDTGDGIICLFWNKTHSWTALRIGVAMYELLTKFQADAYRKFLNENKINDDFGFGIGIHCDSSLVYRSKTTQQDFMFGSVLNSTARLESFTKTFKNINLLFTEHFIDVLKTQMNDFNKKSKASKTLKFSELENDLKLVCKEKIEINDAKKIGHSLWTIKENHNLLQL